MKFAGKVIVVTGASSGIGRQAAIDFAKRGAVWFKHTLPYVVQPIVGIVSRHQMMRNN